MRWRRITEYEVEQTVRNPDLLEPADRGRSNAFKWIGDRYIKVTYSASGTVIVIVTVVDRAD